VRTVPDGSGGETQSFWIPECSNRVFKTQEEALAAPLRKFELRRSNRYGFFANVQATPIDFSIDYRVDQTFSATFSAHLNLVADAVEQISSRESSICEIGSGSGSFLSILAARSFKALKGFDESHKGDDSRIEKSYPSDRHAPLGAQLLILRHTLDYIINPASYLANLRRINGHDCDLMIEVPCFDWILSQGHFWDLTFERINYFTEDSLEALFGNDLVKISRVFDGQYLLVHARLRDRVELPDHFQTDTCQEQLRDFGYAQSENLVKQLGDSAYWIWGAGSKGVMFLHHHLRWRPLHIPLGCVDINPMRQGTFIPSTGLEIMSPTKFRELFRTTQPVVVLNHNYVDEVARSIEELTGASARIIAP
jgi:hypothetical protein